MKIAVQLVDTSSTTHSLVSELSTLKLLKHASLAGLGPSFAYVPMIFSAIGLGFYLGSRFTLRGTYIERTHPIYDPDEIGQMSRIMGRAIADIFAKSHFGAVFTLSYEHSLSTAGINYTGLRPDFYCIDSQANLAFSVEAKGFTQKTISSSVFSKYKAKSAAGPLPVSFGVASVTHNIYRSIQARIEDPPAGEGQYDEELARLLISDYLTTVRQRLAHFCEIVPSPRRFEATHTAFDLSPYLVVPPRGRQPNVIFIVPSGDTLPPNSETLDQEDIYIDKDGIGVLILRQGV